MPPDADADQLKVGDVAEAAGLRTMHILAWRDLADVEAGGSEVHADEIASRWADAGLDVVMRTSHAAGHLERARRNGYRVVRRRGRHLVFLDAPLQELLGRDGRRDGLLEVWNGLPFFTPLWARGPRATFVHHVHADMWRAVMSPGLARLGEVLEQRIAPPLYRRSTVMTPSPSSRDDIVRRLRLPPEHVVAVANGVDERFSPGGERSSTPMVLTVGRLVPHKRLDLLVRAVAAARDQVSGLQLVVVGDGYERPALEAVLDELDATAWVHVLGRVSDDRLVDLYRQAWVVASASQSEGWGMTITEAAACGTPAVVTRIPGHVDVVDDGRSGLLVDAADDLTSALGRVLGDPDLRERLGRGAIERARSLSWDRAAVDVLRGVAGRLHA